MSDRRPIIAAGAVWAVLVLATAIPVHAPDPRWVLGAVLPGSGGWTPDVVAAAALRMLRAGAALVLLLAVVRGAGGRATRWLRIGGAHWAAGLVIAGLLATALALTGLARGALPVVVAALLIRLPRRGALRRGWPSAVRDARSAGRLPVLAACGFVLIAAVHALAPEITADALRATLGTPQDALAIGRLVPDAASPFAWYPVVPTGLVLLLLPVGGEAAVRLAHVLAWAATGALLWRWVRDLAGPRLASVAAALWLAGLNASVVASCAWTDHLLAWMVLGAARRQISGGGLRAAGLLWGAVASIKLQAAWPLAGALAAAVMVRGPRSAAGMLLWMLPSVLPWLLRNALQAGHPAAPLGMAWGADGIRTFAPPYPPVAAWEAARDLPALLTAPWRCAVGVGVWDGLLSPALVAVLPLAATAARPAGLRVMLFVALAGWAWTAGYGGRYLLPVAPLALVAAAAGAAALAGRRGLLRPVRLLVWSAIGLEAAASLALSFRLFHPAPVAWGRERVDAYLRRVSDPRPAAWDAGRDLASRLGPRDRYLLADSLALPGWPGRPRADEEGLPPRLAGFAARSIDAHRMAVALRQQGIGWIVIRTAPREPDAGLRADERAWTPRRREVATACLTRHAKLERRIGNSAGAFELRRVACRAPKDR